MIPKVFGDFKNKNLNYINFSSLTSSSLKYKSLPKGFQTAEFVLEHGFLDKIIPRTELKAKLSSLLQMFKN